jgi:hypothetical protein
MTISDQTGDDIDDEVSQAAMASVFDLRDILALVDNGFNNRSFYKARAYQSGSSSGSSCWI